MAAGQFGNLFHSSGPQLAFLTSFIGSWGSKSEVREFPRSSFKNVLFSSMLSYLTPLCPAELLFTAVYQIITFTHTQP